MARSLGVTQLIVAVNKLERADWSKTRYDELVAIIKPYLISVSLKESDITFVPLSGLSGENLIEPSKDTNLISWWSRGSLVDILDKLRTPPRNLVKP